MKGRCFPWLYVLILLDVGGIQEYVLNSSVDPKEKHVTVGSWTVGRAPDLRHQENRAQCLAQSRYPHNYVRWMND